MFPINDVLDAILLGCFLFGILFTIASFALGFADVGIDGDHGGDLGGDHGADHGGDIFGGLLNISSILAFITWFGGIGYLIREGAGWGAPIALILGIAGGFAAALAVAWFMVRVLKPAGKELDPADYETQGVIARVSSSIRSGGYGEIVYELGGTRQTGAARGVNEAPIPRGTDVIVLRVEKGVAIVDTVENLMSNSYPEA